MHDPTTVRVRSALQGDEGEINWLVAHFHPLVLVHVRDRLGGFATDDDVRDLADDVWLVALRRLGDLTPREGRLTPVLARFLSNT